MPNHTLPRARLRQAVLLALAFLPLAGAARATDLIGITHDALENDPTYIAARYTQAATAEARPQALSALLPQLNLTMADNVNRVHVNGEVFQFNQSTHSWGPSVQLTMAVFNLQNWDLLAESQLTVAQSEAQLSQARADLLIRVAQAYFDVLASQDALAALVENKKAVSEQLAQAQREFEVGTKTIVDTHEAKARYDQIDAQEQVARGDLLVKQAALRAIVGHDPGPLQPLRDPVELASPKPADVEAWAHQAEGSNFSVIAAAAGDRIAHKEVNKARDAYLPTLAATGTLQQQRVSGQVIQQTNGVFPLPIVTSNTSSVGLLLTIPLFTGGYTQSKLREAHAREDKAAQDLEFAKRLAAQQARQAYTGVDYGLAQVHALESAEVSARSQLDSTRLGYQVGVRINLDVLNANTQLFNTQRDLKKARYDFLMNGLKLKSAAGALIDTDVEAVNSLLAKPN